LIRISNAILFGLIEISNAILFDRKFGLNHGTGHFGLLQSPPQLAVGDSEALAEDQRMPKSPQTSTGVSDRKIAPLRLSRLPA
jgi:hypothetical protein